MVFGSFISETDGLPLFARIYLKIFGVPVLGAWQRYKLMHSLSNINKDERILDLGIGGGLNAISMIREGFYVFGIDISKEGVTKATKRARKLNLPLRFVLADGTYIPFKRETFDKVFCIEVFEHIHNNKMAISEISRVLKKQGKVCISNPIGNPSVIYPNSHGKYHVREGYTEEYLESFFVKYSFELKEILYFERQLAKIARNIYYKVQNLFRSAGVFHSKNMEKRPCLVWVYIYFILPLLFPILDILYRADVYSQGEATSIMLLFRKEGVL